MPRINRILTLAAIAAATAASVPMIAGAAPSAGSGSASGSNPTPADLAAAELAATHTSAPLYQLGLVHIHAIPPIAVTATADPDGSQLGDAAIGVGAIAAPAASARFHVAPDGTSSATAQSQTTTAPVVVRPNPDQETQQSLPGAPPILPRVSASEQAAIDRAQTAEAQALAYSPPPTARYSSAEFNAYASAVHPVAATTPTVKAPGGGFDWGDAGIGAAVGLALSMLGLAGALTLSQRRARRSSRSAALTS